MNLRLLLSLLLFCVFCSWCAGCAAPKSSEAVHLDVRYASTADPIKDVLHAIHVKEYRFIVVDELSSFPPGAQDAFELVEKYGQKVIEGTSDTPEDPDMQAEAFDYATVYNIILKRHLKHKSRE